MPEFVPGGPRGITVSHDSWMEGGGTWFGQEYVDIIRDRYPGRTFRRCYEWCSGPAFIGFALLDHGLCESLCVSDIYEPAIRQAVDQTVQRHGLGNIVSAYVAGSLRSLPITEQFDLVVANPPHYLECPGDDNYQRIAVDHEWTAHADFYQHIAQHLEPDAVVLIQENRAGSVRGVSEFEHMIKASGLEISAVIDSPGFMNQPGPWCQIYYIEMKLAR